MNLQRNFLFRVKMSPFWLSIQEWWLKRLCLVLKAFSLFSGYIVTTTTLKEHDFNINMLLERGSNHLCVIFVMQTSKISPDSDIFDLYKIFAVPKAQLVVWSKWHCLQWISLLKGTSNWRIKHENPSIFKERWTI